jgi:hypothetical protein
MLDACLIEPGAEYVEAVLERTADHHLFASFQDLPDEFES